jgi:hypothetical protein
LVELNSAVKSRKPVPTGGAGPVKKPKKKIALPRRRWQINPSTRVKTSAKAYSRENSKLNLRKSQNEE